MALSMTPNGYLPSRHPKRLAAERAERYQPKTGQACSCRRGVQRDNCSACEGTGHCIDFAKIRRDNTTMGSLQASEMARLTDLDTALSWHLRSNHYPPVPLQMLPTCKAAIEACQDEDYRKLIRLPSGVLWKGHEQAPASAIVESYHLDAFIRTEG